MNLQILTSYHLKIIAIITMVIDHIGIIFFPSESIFRIIGRIAFILFAFMIAEGMKHSKNENKYIIRLFLWALVSEVPFDLAFYNTWLEINHQNVLLTFVIATIGIHALKSDLSKLSKTMVLLCTIIASITLNVDYGLYGIAIIHAFYWIKDKAIKLVTVQILSIVATFTSIQIWAGIALLILPFYNGRKGKNIGKLAYVIYPLHMALLYITKQVIKVL